MNVFKGTVKELTAKGVTVNGVKIKGTDVSALVRLGLAKVVGHVPTATGRGKPSNIVELSDTALTVSE